MTCSTCGNVVAQDARFCPACGTQATFQPPPSGTYVPVSAGLRDYRVSRNLHTLGTLWLCYAALRFLLSSFAILFLHGMFGRHFGHSDFTFGWSPFGRMGMDGLWPIAIFSLMTSVACIVLTGYALLTRQPWGRILAIVFAIFALFHFPFGTALGIYTLWVLAPRISGDEYAAIAYAQHGA